MTKSNKYVMPGDTVIINLLQVMKYDQGLLNWYDATDACATLGDGWRLPTNEELELMYENKDRIGGFVNGLYWSKTEVPPANAYISSMVEQHTANDNKNYLFYVRAVRSVSTIKVNGIEVLSTDLATSQYDQAVANCKSLGSGWRLPNVDELNMLFKNRDMIGGFVNSFYWGSTEIEPGKPCIQGFIDGKQSKDAKNYLFHVRPVRDTQ